MFSDNVTVRGQSPHCARLGCVDGAGVHCLRGTRWRLKYASSAVAFTGLVASAAVLAQAAPNPNQQNWHRLGAAVTFGLGDQTCEEGWHQILRRDWHGHWWWGPCVPNR
jgi:hypothetical protein